MLMATDVAEYFLSKDEQRELFTKKLIQKNGRSFYEGNARLNKYLHITQNLFIAKTGRRLFEDSLYAYDNGAVVTSVQENYSILFARNVKPDISSEISDFLDRVFLLLRNATLDELIELSHEDVEWRNKHEFYDKQNQKMDSMLHVAEYKEQYADVLRVMEKIKNA